MRQIVHFGRVSNLIADNLPDSPKSIIDGATKLGKLKKKLIKPKNLTGIKAKIGNAIDEVGAVTGVVTTAAGAGVNKYLGKNVVGKKLKRAGVDTVLNDRRRKVTGGAVLATPVLATGAIGATLLSNKKSEGRKKGK
jgi:hypothetical protein